MVVYIEYVLLENFMLDGTLLYLACHAAKVKASWKKLLVSALLGALFALLFPLLYLPPFLEVWVKFFFGFVLCLIVFLPIKRQKDWGRYAFTCCFFFLFAFGLGGAIFALYSAFSYTQNGYLTATTPITTVVCFTVVFVFIVRSLVKKWYQKRAIFKHIYNCAIAYKQRRVAVLGFYDSGNFASKHSTPVCFITPDIAYDLQSAEIFTETEKAQGQVCDEIVVASVGGEKTLPLFKADLEISTNSGVLRKTDVYFAVSPHIISREYKLLLHTSIFDENT